MDHLRHLGDDIIELSRQLNRKMELTTFVLLDKVKASFSGTGGVARQFVGDMSKLATDFFMDARVYEAQLDSANTEAFHSRVLGLQERVDVLLGQAAALEDTYQHSKASFDNILAEAATTLCHLEFVQYLTERSLHIQQSIRKSSATPAPVPRPTGVNLKSEQENPSGSKPKASDPDSPETCPTPRTISPITPSKPPVTLTKPEATSLKISDASLRPPATPKKCALMPQKMIPGGSGNSAKDILDCITARYQSGMSPQYSNVLALLTSGKSSQAKAPKCTEPSVQNGGDHSYIKPMRSDSDSDRKKVEPPNKKAKCVPGSRPEVADASVTEYCDPPKNTGIGPYLLCKTDPGSLLALYASLNMDPLCAVCDTIFLFGSS